jgi:hypothetical protein
MLQSLINMLFGCSHRKTSFPITPARRGAAFSGHGAGNGTYVVCLDCGKEFAYNWNEMRVGEPVETPAAQPEAQPSFR